MLSVLKFAAHFRAALVSLAGFIGFAQGRAALVWQESALSVAPPVGHKIGRATFHFVNGGTMPVSILNVKPSCGCVAIQIEKTLYAPGDTGTLRITWDLEMDEGGGHAEKTILVTTDDAPQAPKLLKLTAVTTDVADVSSGTVVWAVGQKNQAQVVRVTAGDFGPVLVTELVAHNPRFVISIKKTKPARECEVSIRPTTTATPCVAQIHLKAAEQGGKFEDILIVAAVK